jgi:peptide/nickel transport system substrate-binding protein
LLADSGYAGEPITCMAAQDIPPHRACADVTVDLLKRLDMKVDFAAVDWGTVVARIPQKSPPAQGGWHISHVYTSGAESIDPTLGVFRASGDLPGNGWANIPQVEAEDAASYDAKTLDDEKAIVRRLNKAALDNAIYAPLGLFLQQQAWRKNVSGIVQAPLPLFWGVSKTA